MEPDGPYLLVCANVSRMREWYYRWTGSTEGNFYLLGRERNPPLCNLKLGRPREKYRVLATHRAARVSSTSDIQAIVAVVLKHGWNVDHDLYIFHEDGGWLLHVSHHDEVCVMVSLERPTSPTCRQAAKAAADDRVKIAKRPRCSGQLNRKRRKTGQPENRTGFA